MEPKTKTKKKRPYTKDPLTKIQQGKEWKILIPIDHDVALLILEEKSNSPLGTEYTGIINKRLRMAYSDQVSVTKRGKTKLTTKNK